MRPNTPPNGIPFPAIGERLDILVEGIKVVRLLLTMERATYIGEHFTLTDAACEPKPLQANPRIWVGGNGEKRTLRIVARHCDGWNSPIHRPTRSPVSAAYSTNGASGRDATPPRSNATSISPSTSRPMRRPAPGRRRTSVKPGV